MTKPKEVRVIDKVLNFIKLRFPDELKKAVRVYEKEPESAYCEDELLLSRGFIAWFLLNYKIAKGATPLQIVLNLFPDYFTREEKKIIVNFINFHESLFEIKDISTNKKDYLIEDAITNKEFLVKTIDFDSKLDVGDFILAKIIKKLEGDYFFYGNVAGYSQENGLKLKEDLIKEYEKEEKTDKIWMKNKEIANKLAYAYYDSLLEEYKACNIKRESKENFGFNTFAEGINLSLDVIMPLLDKNHSKNILDKINRMLKTRKTSEKTF